jgi:hypothetical protein
LVPLERVDVTSDTALEPSWPVVSRSTGHGSVFNGARNWYPQVLLYGVFQYFERSRRSWDAKKKHLERIRAASEKCGIVVSVVGIAGSRFHELSTVLCPEPCFKCRLGLSGSAGRQGVIMGEDGESLDCPQLARRTPQAPSLEGERQQIVSSNNLYVNPP